MTPETTSGQDAARMRGLFGGETFERASDWVAAIEAEARSLAIDRAVEAVEAAYEQHRSRAVEDGTGDETWVIGSVSGFRAAVIEKLESLR